ncbi:LysR family transcriptional regulator [Cryptosporangium phraense]|uniref:LysR family transcriptional regulator n=1 Tax=Cryptosporangium phraense TaxID=2593070 RepID=A0A545AM19_9ACTN|nr:LysR family transcriptional regulator [Cryptosporangium phraense]TQS42367.1 LysR family transcriptional regulator [Cryptosporangium phraense]
MDLNLLTALDALLEENSVQAAADRLHLSAPAMSRTLTRIRKATGDDILVRTGRTMTPTPRALALRDEVRTLVQRAGEVLTPTQALDLATLRRTFTIQGHDALVGAVAPQVLAAATEAPGVTVRFLAEAPVDTPDLARGHVDLELGSAVPAPEINHQVVGEDRLIVVSRDPAPLTLERFAAADHVLISRRGRTRDGLDERLAERGLRRRVVATMPTVASAIALVGSGSAVVVVAERLSAPVRAAFGVRAHPLDLDLPAAPVVLSWHRRYDSDPAHSWLRGHCADALRAALALI